MWDVLDLSKMGFGSGNLVISSSSIWKIIEFHFFLDYVLFGASFDCTFSPLKTGTLLSMFSSSPPQV